ncbi:MAG: hypothetical protein ACK5H2_02055 [Beutenbergiaceae bacterium]
MTTPTPSAGPPLRDDGGHHNDLRTTYRYLRLAIIMVTSLLATSVVIQIGSDDWQVLPSVSAYYYTPARATFVASLCAIGVCMIVHKGRSATEDTLLNFAGYMAFFVAFVPTANKVDIADAEAEAVIPPDLQAAIINNSWAVLIIGMASLTIWFILAVRQPGFRFSRSGGRAAIATVVAFVGWLTYFLFFQEAFVNTGHVVAAIALFAGIVGVVGINGVALARARAEEGGDKRAQVLNRYTIGFIVMVLSTAFVLVVLRPRVAEYTFWLEALLIGQFLAFWLTQTIERWRVPEPRQDSLIPG